MNSERGWCKRLIGKGFYLLLYSIVLRTLSLSPFQYRKHMPGVVEMFLFNSITCTNKASLTNNMYCTNPAIMYLVLVWTKISI